MLFQERPHNPEVSQYLNTKHYPSWINNLLARRIQDPTALDNLLNTSLSQLTNPNLLPDMDIATDLLFRIIEQGLPIVCVVDYDTDGICSGAVLQEGLKHLGANVQVMVTNRYDDGYGFSAGACDKVLALTPRPALLITADLGSSDGLQLTRLKQTCAEQGDDIRIIVTDHHHISQTHPPRIADSFINPNRVDIQHQYHHPICGAMVAWNLVAALRGIIRQQLPQDTRTTYDVRSLLDLVAIATIGDMVNLASPINRSVVMHGLKLINTATRPAWQLLKEHIGVQTPITEDTIGFQISPRINALSRMGDDGHTALTWLTTTTMHDCQQAWMVMNQNNDDRKDEQALCERLAMMQAQQQVDDNKFIIVCHVPEATHGVVGLAAGRIANTYGRPAIVFADSHTGQLTGSARSIPGYDIRALIERSQDFTESIQKYGGHAAAAGLTIDNEASLNTLSHVLEQLIREDFAHQAPSPTLLHDGQLPSEILTQQGLQQLKAISPFGQGFPAPLFCLTTTIITAQSMGKSGQHAKLKLNHPTMTIDAVWFNPKTMPIAGERYLFALSITENYFRGNVTIQALITAAQIMDT